MTITRLKRLSIGFFITSLIIAGSETSRAEVGTSADSAPGIKIVSVLVANEDVFPGERVTYSKFRIEQHPQIYLGSGTVVSTHQNFDRGYFANYFLVKGTILYNHLLSENSNVPKRLESYREKIVVIGRLTSAQEKCPAPDKFVKAEWFWINQTGQESTRVTFGAFLETSAPCSENTQCATPLYKAILLLPVSINHDWSFKMMEGHSLRLRLSSIDSLKESCALGSPIPSENTSHKLGYLQIQVSTPKGEPWTVE